MASERRLSHAEDAPDEQRKPDDVRDTRVGNKGNPDALMGQHSKKTNNSGTGDRGNGKSGDVRKKADRSIMAERRPKVTFAVHTLTPRAGDMDPMGLRSAVPV